MFSFAKKLVDRFESTNSNDDSYFKDILSINNGGYGLRVLHVEPHSVGQDLGFEAWFDYIIKINNHELPMSNPAISQFQYNINDDGTLNYEGRATQDLAAMVNFDLITQEIDNVAQQSKQVLITLWNAKGGVVRNVIIPLDVSEITNSNFKSIIPKFKNIGITLQAQHVNTATHVWRILNTHTDSPAFQAQLIPYSDYIIGCDSGFPGDPYGKGLLSQGGESLLSKTVLAYYNHNFEKSQNDSVPITLYVYNHDYDVLRPVTVNLTRLWGDGHSKGILGCDVGYGLLHRLPEVIGKFENRELTDDVLFEETLTHDYQFNLLPASGENSFTPMVSLPSPPKGIKKKKQPRSDALQDLNNYMNEELQKSKEADVIKPSAVSDNSSIPPPPKTSD